MGFVSYKSRRLGVGAASYKGQYLPLPPRTRHVRGALPHTGRLLCYWWCLSQNLFQPNHVEGAAHDHIQALQFAMLRAQQKVKLFAQSWTQRGRRQVNAAAAKHHVHVHGGAPYSHFSMSKRRLYFTPSPRCRRRNGWPKRGNNKIKAAYLRRESTLLSTNMSSHLSTWFSKTLSLELAYDRVEA